MLLLRGAQQMALARATARRGISSSAVRLGGSPPVLHLPPPPPPEFEPDGSPKKYPLHQPLWDHGYDWENWVILPAGAFHTVYMGEFAQDYPPYWAWLQKYPMWVASPFLITASIVFMVIFQNMGSIGIKPKRYTIEWQNATKERERIENTNPVTRYLDRRRNERGTIWLAQQNLPWHPYWIWMGNSHDPEYPEFYSEKAPVPGDWAGPAIPRQKCSGDKAGTNIKADE
eukprot:gnl/TRDRNA2_/TRDRNA2_167791_c0_seq1.p1 gnl/TRDRNA2_/TRDRNA2_167791_c0~~gnl/TRDRNA2_/TRDRNA2_167791_c0_seq1.p1  ORF type:complete len:229 (+),score=43.81 gnl/TRDRNA2_/TRDRNA2_167791_c0_seq1:62-748(+)